MNKVMLRYDADTERWILWYSTQIDDEVSYEMHVQYCGCGEYDYRFVMWMSGEEYICVTPKEYEQHVQDIRDNEGHEMATAWHAGQNVYWVLPAHRDVYKLRAHWEAMITLGLFIVPVSHKKWRTKPLSPDLVRQLDAIREEQMKQTADEMAAEMEGADLARTVNKDYQL